MKKNYFDGFTTLTFFAGLLCGLMIAFGYIQSDNYKQGQIDALNGIVKYKKETQKDSTVIWVEIKQK
jgi:hypothetical protein